MINRTVLVGRLTRDPEIRYTQGGTAVMGFTVAVNRQFTNSQGEREADFINCVIWRKAAENFAKFTNKGSLVGIDGRLQTRNYENQQGNRVYVTEVVVENFSLLESRKDTEERQEQNNKNDNTNSDYVSKNNLPMDQRNSGNNNSMGQRSGETNDSMGQRGQGSTEQGNQMSDPFTDNSKPIDISDDDLPF